MGSNGKGADSSKKVQVFVARHEAKEFTKIVVTDADGNRVIVEMMVPDGVIVAQMHMLPEDSDVLKSLRALLGICFDAVINSMTDIIEGR